MFRIKTGVRHLCFEPQAGTMQPDSHRRLRASEQLRELPPVEPLPRREHQEPAVVVRETSEGECGGQSIGAVRRTPGDRRRQFGGEAVDQIGLSVRRRNALANTFLAVAYSHMVAA